MSRARAGHAPSLALLLLQTAFSSAPARAQEPPQALVLNDDLPGLDRSLARRLIEAAARAGYAPLAIDASRLCDAARLRPGPSTLLVIPAARSLPAAAAEPIIAFLRGGGDLLALGVPAWGAPAARMGGRWLTREDFDRALAEVRPASTIESFDAANLSRWRRATNDGTIPVTHELVTEGAGRALHVALERLTGWETFQAPADESPFPAGHVLTCFRARGGAATRQLALEWEERDGSRWIATVDLTPAWRWYALPPEAFQAWQPPPGRGGPGDGLKLAAARRFTVGLALTHTAQGGGRHEYWLDDLGTAPGPFGAERFSAATDAPHLEGLSPSYLFHAARETSRLRTPPDLRLVSPVDIPAPEALVSHHPRPGGAGFAQERAYRWQPLLEARGQGGEHRGTVGQLLVYTAGPLRGAAIASFTPAAAEVYAQPAIERLLDETLLVLRRGVFLVEGGAERYTALDGEPVRLGALVASSGAVRREGLTLQIAVLDRLRPERRVLEAAWTIDAAAGASARVERRLETIDAPDGGLLVRTDLRREGRVIDSLVHELHVRRVKAAPRFVEARDGGFWLDGKRWKAHGVNYMPSSGIALQDGTAFEHWLGRGAYDPEIVQRDLERLRGLGMNAVSIFIYRRSLEAMHLPDFLRRCEALGLRVNLSLRPGTPMDFRGTEMREIIERCRLAGEDTVFAYDLAWEPSHFDARHQRGYRSEWRVWVERKHGGPGAAERDWGYAAPRDGDELDVPPPRFLLEDGPWRRLAADYRRFLDELVGSRYAEARRQVRALDPHHPVSFRMQFAGDPTHSSESLLPYDFRGLAGAVDIWEPEAYGRVGDWDRVKTGRFTAAYARLCDAAKPVFWAEAGYDVWSRAAGAPDPARLEAGERFYRDFYRMLRESGADGICFWWYAGGYRLNERSDFGIIEPDGTDRSITRAIREEGPAFLAAPKRPAPDVWLDVDRDADARGLFGLYERVREAFWRAVDAGHEPGLRWRP